MSDTAKARSFLNDFGHAEAARVMGKAIAEAALENREAGLRTVSCIDGQLVFSPGKKAWAVRSRKAESRHEQGPRSPS